MMRSFGGTVLRVLRMRGQRRPVKRRGWQALPLPISDSACNKAKKIRNFKIIKRLHLISPLMYSFDWRGGQNLSVILN